MHFNIEVEITKEYIYYALLPGVSILSVGTWSSHSTVVEHWTAGQQVEYSVLHLGHDSYQNLISLGCCHHSIIALQYKIVALENNPPMFLR